MKREIKKTFTYSGRPSIKEKIVERAEKEGLTFSEKVDQLLERDIKPDVAYAVKVLTAALRRDKGFFKSYEANIAMAFKDECDREGYPISQDDTMGIANKAANNFMNLWIKK